MAKRKKEEPPKVEPEKPKKHPALEAWVEILDAIPKGKYRDVYGAGNVVEAYLRCGLSALSLLSGIRQYALDTGALGGEESPFVKKIDELVPRDDAQTS